MAQWKIAHIREQGVDLIIVPLERAFGNRPRVTQNEFIEALQLCADSANLAGRIVPVWQEGNSFRFIAPSNWHPFFKSLSWNFIIGNLNKTLTCQ
ncbi:hypothetical protein [Paraburkholderia phenoliruptrix]|uniref:hypothetical protein n=1 Tax=Paraburkholderia phenoliruptrix TaxID=252970 RepID=UPI003D98B5FD